MYDGRYAERLTYDELECVRAYRHAREVCGADRVGILDGVIGAVHCYGKHECDVVDAMGWARMLLAGACVYDPDEEGVRCFSDIAGASVMVRWSLGETC